MVRCTPDSPIDGDVLVFDEYMSLSRAFEQNIERSELLSRGWVYQEVLLTSANLFCTPDQMWWSCFTSSSNQMFPKAIPETRGHELYPFVDSIRRRKGNMMSSKESEDWLKAWIDIIKNYSATSVTFSGDRVVAIAGLAKVFGSRFPNLQHAVFHSGVWSTDIMPQLLWFNCYSRGHRFIPHATHPIPRLPSWSPLSGQGKWDLCYPMRHDEVPGSIYVAECVSMQTSGLDRFGRAKEQKDCVLHLRGLLLPLQINLLTDSEGSPHPNPSHPPGPHMHASNVTGYEDQNIWIYCDTEEKEETAISTSGPSFALPCVLSIVLGGTSISIDALVLKPYADLSHRDYTGNETDRRLWVRCGWFTTQLNTSKKSAEAFQLSRLGFTGVFDNDGGMEVKATGDAPDLGDVYVV